MKTTKTKRAAISAKIILLSLISFVSYAKDTEYFTSLRYNHVSLHAEIKGIFPISKEAAKTQPHYVFNYDNRGRLSEIENNSYGNPRRHPLTNFGSKWVRFSYPEGKQIRQYFDVNNQLMANIRGVHKEEFKVDSKGFIYQLNFYNDKDQAVESRWNITEYRWQKQDNLVIERRFNLKGEKQPLSPYFRFADTAIEYDKAGNPKRQYNLDDNLNIVNDDKGIAYYEDDYDAMGRHTRYSYFNQDKNMALNQWGFGYADKHYDEQGYYTGVTRYDLDGNKIERPDPFKNYNEKQDRSDIKRVSTDYLNALKNMQPALMEEVIHKDLHKHFISLFPAPDGSHSLRQTTYQRLMDFARNWNRNGLRFPPEMTVEVTILDLHRNMATVKMLSDNWIEYLHLVKIKDRWQIKNILWDYKS